MTSLKACALRSGFPILFPWIRLKHSNFKHPMLNSSNGGFDNRREKSMLSKRELTFHGRLCKRGQCALDAFTLCHEIPHMVFFTTNVNPLSISPLFQMESQCRDPTAHSVSTDFQFRSTKHSRDTLLLKVSNTYHTLHRQRSHPG